MLNYKEKTKYSKFLSLILRHHPEVAGITLDLEGWTDIDNLLVQLNNFFTISKAQLMEIVETDEKCRYAISENGKKIRANQGHSLNLDIKFEKVNPPEYLYHGTSVDKVDSIMENGILPMQRQYVHLSKDYNTAFIVGERHGESVVLEVASQLMIQDGIEFFKSVNGVYLTKFVPNKYIKVLKNNQLDNERCLIHKKNNLSTNKKV